MEQGKFGFQPNIENMENYLKENESNNNTYDGPMWWTIPRGTSSVRILPPWDPTGRVALPVYMHNIEYKGEGMRYPKYNWTCVNKTFGKPCNICEGLANISAAGVDISPYEPNRRQFYYNAIIMFDPDYDRDIRAGKKPEDCGGYAPGTHVLMKSPKVVYDWIISQITSPMVGDITSIERGIDIHITKEGDGLGTTYTCTLSPNGRQPVPQEYLDKIDSLYNLDEIFQVGFEQDQINGLVNSLMSSATNLGTGIPNMTQQMNPQQFTPINPGALNPTGNVQVPPQTTVGNVPGVPNVPVNNIQPNPAPVSNQFSAIPTAPTPFGGMPQANEVPFTPNVPAAPQSNPAPAADVPACYGNYRVDKVDCVTCASELRCQRDSANR